MRRECLSCGLETIEEPPPALCSRCGLAEPFVEPDGPESDRPTLAETPRSLADMGESRVRVRPSGCAVVDQLLNGGVIIGGTIALHGPPGSGKSTLGLLLAAGLGPALVVVPEMSMDVLRMTAARSGADVGKLYPGDPERWPAEARRLRVRAVLYDSVSVAANGVHVLSELIDWARESNGHGIAIAHETKDGKVLGPVRLIHDPDAVLRLARPRGKDVDGPVLTVKKCRWAPVGSAPFTIPGPCQPST